MGKKRSTRLNNFKDEVLDVIRISENEKGQIFFEIDDYITQDIAEAVAIMMRKDNIDKSIWSKEIKIDVESMDSRKCLYWLSGGDNEWIKLHNYKKPWIDCDSFFLNEYDFVVRWVVKKSKKLEDIKNGFIEHLNLPILYEFALSKNIIR
jgi:hypothetical protein